MSGIYEAPSQAEVSGALRRRIADSLDRMSPAAVQGYLAEAVYLERRRFAANRGHLSDEDRSESAAIEEVARAIHRDRAAMERSVLLLTDRYAREVHNRFSAPTYRFATRLMPGALTRLLTAAAPSDLLGADFDPASRIVVQGDVDRIRELGERYTLILAPTHLSNLDSPLLGYALYAAGLPPFLYGAGLNLFSNPAMAFFMRRLGAYTVDRRKKHRLYKDVLKGYSIDSLSRRCHSLFFPGGTRARSGQVEKKVKKGLLGTGIIAWQEALARHEPNPDILVVPCTLTMALVLEAETLIEDSLAEEGKSRYIISDDEFSEPRTVASFARRVLNLDAAVYVRFGQPMDLLGNPVDEQGRSLDHAGEAIDRTRYVTDRDGQVQWDEQRDRVYTDELCNSLVRAWHRDTIALSTHLAGFAAWNLLRARFPGQDVYQIVFQGPDDLVLTRAELLGAVDRVSRAVLDRVGQGRIQHALPDAAAGRDRAEAILDRAVERFARFHTRKALDPVRLDGTAGFRVDPRLALYYGNRLVGFDLESHVHPAAPAHVEPPETATTEAKS